MPTEEEYIAIMALAIKAKRNLSHMHKTEEQVETVIKWANKYIKARERGRKYGREYMREKRKIDPDYGHYYVPKKNGKGKTAKRGENYKQYQHEYYVRVTKPKRQAQKGEK